MIHIRGHPSASVLHMLEDIVHSSNLQCQLTADLSQVINPAVTANVIVPSKYFTEQSPDPCSNITLFARLHWLSVS